MTIRTLLRCWGGGFILGQAILVAIDHSINNIGIGFIVTGAPLITASFFVKK